MTDIDSIEDVTRAVLRAVCRGPVERGAADGDWAILDSRENSDVKNAVCRGMGIELARSFKSDAYHAFAVDVTSPFAASADELKKQIRKRVPSKGEDVEPRIPGAAIASLVYLEILRVFFESGVQREFIETLDLYDRVEDFAKEVSSHETVDSGLTPAALAARAYVSMDYGDGVDDRSWSKHKTGCVNEVVSQLCKWGLLEKVGTRVVPTERFAEFGKAAVFSAARRSEFAVFFGELEEEEDNARH